MAQRSSRDEEGREGRGRPRAGRPRRVTPRRAGRLGQPGRPRLVAWRTMAHKKGGGSSRNGRDSNAKRLGVKAFGGAGHPRGLDHRAPARHADPPRRGRRQGRRRHAVRPARRHRAVPRVAGPQVRLGRRRPSRCRSRSPHRVHPGLQLSLASSFPAASGRRRSLARLPLRGLALSRRPHREAPVIAGRSATAGCRRSGLHDVRERRRLRRSRRPSRPRAGCRRRATTMTTGEPRRRLTFAIGSKRDAGRRRSVVARREQQAVARRARSVPDDLDDRRRGRGAPSRPCREVWHDGSSCPAVRARPPSLHGWRSSTRPRCS